MLSAQEAYLKLTLKADPCFRWDEYALIFTLSY